MNTGPLQIVKLLPNQWQEYKTLRLHALQSDPQAFGSSYEEDVVKPDTYWIERLRDVKQGNSWLFFAKEHNNLVGMIGGYKKPEDPQEVVHVIAVYVLPSARSRGISKKLMYALLEDLQKNDHFTTAKLAVNVLQTAAIHLYRSSGFKEVGKVTVKLGDGKYYVELLMEKRLLV